MKILTILGSPRKNGNSEKLAGTVAGSLAERLQGTTEFIRLEKCTIAPCSGCGGCSKTGLCIIKDDMATLYPLIDSADIVLLASPTYFYGLSAQTKCFIDRIQARWSRKYLLKQRIREHDKRCGYLLCTAATHGKKLFDGSVLVAKSFFDAVDIAYCGELLVRGVDDKNALANNAAELERAIGFSADIAKRFQ